MKSFLIIFSLSMCFASIYGQNNKATMGPVINEFGQVYPVNTVDLHLDKNIKYKVIFDIYTDSRSKTEINPLINTVARFINMHARQEMSMDNFDIVVVLHGPATKNILAQEAFESKYKKRNPNQPLINLLLEQGVDFYVCGQSLVSQGFTSEQVTPEVKISLSAMTALVHFQHEGYQLINFN